MAGLMTGLQPPEAAEQGNLGMEQQMLLKALMEAQGGLTPDPASSGGFKTLNFGGLAAALRGQKAQEALENNRRKQADLQGRYQAGLLREMMKYDGSAEAIKAARLSPYAEVRALAGEDQKRADKVFEGAMPRASLRSIQESGGDLRKLAPKAERQVSDGTVLDMTEGQAPTVVAGGWTQVPGRGGSLTQQNTLTGKIDVPDKAPKIGVRVDAGMKGSEELMKTEGEQLSKDAQNLRKTVPGQLAALDRASGAAASGAYQGPVAKYVQGAVGLMQQLGVSSEAQKAMLANTEVLNSDMGKFVLANVKALGANPSNADREYAQQTAGGQQLSPQGLQRVIEAAKRDIATMVQFHNEHVGRVKQYIPQADIATVEIPGLEQYGPMSPTKAPRNLDDILKKYGQ